MNVLMVGYMMLQMWRERMNKCMVLTNNEHIVCNRDAIIKYYSKVELENGKIVNENIYVCERHKIVFEEMWENQGKNDSL